MIVFDLKCLAAGHVFEAWFGSSEAFEDQRGRGLVECPMCGSPDVEKAVMSPRVGAKGNSDPEAAKAMLATLAAAQKKMLEGSDFVGERFADEARAIHHGEVGRRPIHGKATPDEADSLLEDGIPVAPLPLPIVEPGEEN